MLSVCCWVQRRSVGGRGLAAISASARGDRATFVPWTAPAASVSQPASQIRYVALGK